MQSMSTLARRQRQLDTDADMIKNRVGKLKQIEGKMLRKIERTRIEAERARVIKQKNDERLQHKLVKLTEEDSLLEKKRESIFSEKVLRKNKLVERSIETKVKVLERAREIRLQS